MDLITVGVQDLSEHLDKTTKPLLLSGLAYKQDLQRFPRSLRSLLLRCWIGRLRRLRRIACPQAPAEDGGEAL